tara:strand:+ start:471 stop:929 length:459 start_codon:yes stop_codon:yes gene_type:complete
MSLKSLIGIPLAFGLGYGSTLVWKVLLESMLQNSGAKVVSNPTPEEMWIGGVFALGYFLVIALQAFRVEFQGGKSLFLFCFFSWIGANLGVLLQAMGIASKELPKQLAENMVPTIDMSAYPYLDWSTFGLVSGLFLVTVLVFLSSLLAQEEE